MLSVPLVEVGDGTVHIHCEGEYGFFELLVFHNSSSWLQVGAEHSKCWWDSAAEHSASWGVSPAYVNEQILSLWCYEFLMYAGGRMTIVEIELYIPLCIAILLPSYAVSSLIGL